MDALAMNVSRIRDRSRHAAPQVLEQLREMIVSLELTPGTVLNRLILQKEFGLSSTPIRDALLRLQEEGLVDIFPQHATVVSPIDLALARQAQFLRRSIEQEAVRVLAERKSDRLVDQLRSLIARQKALASIGDLEEFTAADQAFHKAIYDAAEVPDLWGLVRRQSGHIDRLRRLHLPIPGKAAQIIEDHTAIISAIESQDPSLAQTCLRDHLSRSLAFGEEIKNRHPEYFRQ